MMDKLKEREWQLTLVLLVVGVGMVYLGLDIEVSAMPDDPEGQAAIARSESLLNIGRNLLMAVGIGFPVSRGIAKAGKS